MKLIDEIDKRTEGNFIKYLQLLVKADGFWEKLSVQYGKKPKVEEAVKIRIEIEDNGLKVQVEVLCLK